MDIIEEDYVGYEVAKLLHENGFNGCCRCFYNNKKYLVYPAYFAYVKNSELTDEHSAPTQTMACKWLYKCYDILIVVSPNLTLDDKCKGDFFTEVYQYGELVPGAEFGCKPGEDLTQEEAIEAALLYVLQNLM